MSAADQAQVVNEVEREGRGKQRRLRGLGIPRSTYYWWRRRLQAGIEVEPDRRHSPWNRLRPEEEALILAAAQHHQLVPSLHSEQALPPLAVLLPQGEHCLGQFRVPCGLT